MLARVLGPPSTVEPERARALPGPAARRWTCRPRAGRARRRPRGGARRRRVAGCRSTTWATAHPLALWVAGDGAPRPTCSAGRWRSSAPGPARRYGEHVAAELAAGLGDRGWTVVSGGAFGIDAAAHRGALAVDGAAPWRCWPAGSTCAYPRGARRPAPRRAVRAALVVSELPPGSHGRPGGGSWTATGSSPRSAAGRWWSRPPRAAGRSTRPGHAGQLSRAVMAVPGPVTSPTSAGCHKLRADPAAPPWSPTRPTSSTWSATRWARTRASRSAARARPHDGLDPVTLRVLEALPLRRRAAAGQRRPGRRARRAHRPAGARAARGARPGRGARGPVATADGRRWGRGALTRRVASHA